ncbi:MAG: DEAD/DEAH box helicase [Bacteroidales bacterium]
MTLFNETKLRGEILTAVDELEFKQLTPIQEKIIPYLLDSTHDLIALAQTGTGKTAAFGLPIIHQIDTNIRDTQTLILCPTRELCIQITGDLKNFSKHLGKVQIVPVYGGTSMEKQIRDLKDGAHIVVGTPGRVLDLFNRKKLKISKIKWLVLDEADEMLSMGFKDDLEAILAGTPSQKQTMLFSATMPSEISKIAGKYMHNPEEISAGRKNVGAENVHHTYYMVHSKDRYLALKRITDIHPNNYCLIFCRTRSETKEIAEKLIKDGYNADALHGDLSQAQRDQVMTRFRMKHLQMLVATDVAARGLDVNDLTHVINYNLPDDPEVYIHRSGRTGRAGKKGISVSLIHLKEKSKLHTIEKLTGKKFEQKMVPSGKEICEKQIFNLIDKFEKIELNESQIEEYLPVIYKKLAWLSREDLIKHFVSIEFNRFISYYENAPDLNVPEKYEKEKRGSNKDFSRIFINLGSENGVSKMELIELVNKQLSGKFVEIGKIEILKKFSFFEVEESFEVNVLQAFKKLKYRGIRINAEHAKPKQNHHGNYKKVRY